jgi:hypothetical protein
MNYPHMWTLVAALIISNLYAADSANTAIEQAQALALKKNRQEAAQVLLTASANGPVKMRAKLMEALGNIAKVFFTDKGQKLYESGQSMMFDNPDGALVQYREALTIEDNNVLILDNIARLQMAKLDCDGAAAMVQKARLIYPPLSEPAILELRAHVCQKNFVAFREKLKVLPTPDKAQEFFVQYLLAQDLMQQKLWRKAVEVLQKVSEEESQFPETYFSLVKAGRELDRDVDTWAQKYVSLCKAVTAHERKRFYLEPRLCANMKEVEDELAKKSSDL